MAEALGRAGRTADGRAAVEGALAWAESTGERWQYPRFSASKGKLLLLQGSEGAAAAEDHFRQALDWARRQGALLVIARRHQPRQVAGRAGPSR
jgi:hypothetical protein